MSKKIEFISPDTLLRNPAFSQIAITKGSGNTIYIGGQNAITKDHGNNWEGRHNPTNRICFKEH